MDAKILLVGGGLVLAAGYLYYRTRTNQSDTNKADNATADIDDPVTQQALKLYNALGVERSAITNNYGLAVFHNIPEEYVLNLMLEVTDWTALQKKFKNLCNNEYSLVKALSDGLTAEEYNLAIKYASAKKVVTTTATNVTLYDVMPFRTVSVAADSLIGAYTGDTSASYMFVNGIDNDGKEVKGSISKTAAKLV